MLNLPIVMFKLFLILAFIFQNPSLTISQPQSGATLRGLVEVQGQMDIPGFATAELAFTFDAPASDSGAGWFSIQTFPQPILNPTLAVWDTTALTDGDYAIRLRVILQDGSLQDVVITGLKVRNDEALPTATVPPTLADFNFPSPNEPAPVVSGQTATPVMAYPTSTPLPANPASLSNASIVKIFWKSALAAILIFAFFTFILRLRKNI